MRRERKYSAWGINKTQEKHRRKLLASKGLFLLGTLTYFQGVEPFVPAWGLLCFWRFLIFYWLSRKGIIERVCLQDIQSLVQGRRFLGLCLRCENHLWDFNWKLAEIIRIPHMGLLATRNLISLVPLTLRRQFMASMNETPSAYFALIRAHVELSRYSIGSKVIWISKLNFHSNLWVFTENIGESVFIVLERKTQEHLAMGWRRGREPCYEVRKEMDYLWLFVLMSDYWSLFFFVLLLLRSERAYDKTWDLRRCAT